MKNKLLYTLSFCSIMFSCEFFQVKETITETADQRKPIARANSAYLYIEDLEGITQKGMSVEDSTDRVERYINTWAKKQLLIDEASKNIDFDEADIERKILDYRYSLMGYEYQSYYINKNLNKEVSDEEIEAYYTEHIDNFILKENILLGRFVNLPQEAPKTENVSKLLQSDKPEDWEKLNTYCLSFATTYQLIDTTWMNLNEIIKGTPWADTEDKIQLIKNEQYLNSSDSLNTYHIVIHEYKQSGDVAPMPFVKEQIRDIIINKRKIELARKLEQDVYDKAKKNNEIEIYGQ